MLQQLEHLVKKVNRLVSMRQVLVDLLGVEDFINLAKPKYQSSGYLESATDILQKNMKKSRNNWLSNFNRSIFKIFLIVANLENPQSSTPFIPNPQVKNHFEILCHFADHSYRN